MRDGCALGGLCASKLCSGYERWVGEGSEHPKGSELNAQSQRFKDKIF